MLRLFISSVQKEFTQERKALRDYLRDDPLLRRFFDVFLFEDVPAADRRADEVYLDEVKRCDLYLGLFGSTYGPTDADGVSPTEREFDQATTSGKHRLIFVGGGDAATRQGSSSSPRPEGKLSADASVAFPSCWRPSMRAWSNIWRRPVCFGPRPSMRWPVGARRLPISIRG